MARGVDEGDFLAMVVDLVGTDVLGDASGFRRDDIGVPDGVEEGGLAVVDVSHDGDDGRSGFEGLLVILEDGEFRLPFKGLEFDFLDPEFRRDQGCRVKIHILVDGGHDPESHELLDDLAAWLVQAHGQVLDLNLFAQGDLLDD